MKSTFFKCNYTINNQVYNEGYLRIVDNKIFGIFTFDIITIIPGKIGFTLQLNEFDIEENCFLDVKTYFCHSNDKFLESPNTYIFKSNSEKIFSLKILKRITDPKIITEIQEIFEKFPI